MLAVAATVAHTPVPSAETGDDTPSSGAAPPATPPTLSGYQVGDYVLGGVIGAGGMGVVYEATDSLLRRKVAIKVIHPFSSEVAADYASGRLVREARAMARLSHPNVVTIYQVGTIEDRVYIAMEFIDGQTLTDWLTDTRPTWQQALDIMVQAGCGLQAAHAKGLIHRDFKPDNLLIGRDGRVLVTDFGLAREVLTMTDEPAPPLTVTRDRPPNLTQSGAILGTPLYMSPEQHQGRPTDERTDQYSFCVALYEAVYGERPFDGSDMWELAEAKFEGKVRPAPAGAHVPRWLRALLLRGLSPEPSHRFPKFDDLLSAIKRRRTRRRELVAAGAVLIVVGGLGGYATRSSDGEDSLASCTASAQRIASIWNPERSRAVHATFQKTRRPDAATTATYVSTTLDAYVGEWSSMHVGACTATYARHEQSEALLDRRMSCLERRVRELDATIELILAADPAGLAKAPDAVNGLSSIGGCAATDAMLAEASIAITPEMRKAIDRLSGDLAKAAALTNASRLDEARAAAERVASEGKAGRHTSIEAEAVLLIARVRSEAGEFSDAKDMLVRANGLAERAGDPALRVRALSELVYIEGFMLGKFAEGHVWARLANEVIDRAGNLEAMRGRLLVNEASLYFVEGNVEATKAAIEKALEIQRRWLGPNHVDVAYTLEALGSVLLKLGRPADALAHHHAALAIYTRLGESNIHVADALNNLGNALAATGDLAAAEVEYRRALEIWKLPGTKNGNAGIGYANLGSLALTRGDYDAALREYENALAVEEGAFGPTHRSVAETLTSIGAVYVQRGSPAEAIPRLERALKIYDAMSQPPVKQATTRFTLARARWSTDRRGALSLGRTARYQLAAAGAGWSDMLEEVDAWLAERE